MWRFLTVCGFVQVACQGFLVREACVDVLVDGAVFLLSESVQESPAQAQVDSGLISVFSNESALRIRRPKYWSFSFSISPSNKDPKLISLRMDWLDLLAVQGALQSLLNTTVQKHQFFSVQLSL